MTPSHIKRAFGQRIVKILEALRTRFIEAGWHTDEFYDRDTGEDLGGWGTFAVPPGHDELDTDSGVAAEITIQTSEAFGEEPGGLNFEYSVLGLGGLVLAKIAPYNYTPLCWVKRRNDRAVRERFRVFEGDVLTEIAECDLDEFRKKIEAEVRP